MKYVIIGDILYRRSLDGALLRCLTQDEIANILEQAHDGLWGAHFHAKDLYIKILRIGYYWPTMEEDCQTHVKACVSCQKHANLEKQPTQELNYIISPWPFATWGIDLIGMINPYSRGHKFAIIAIKYTTKWAESIPIKSITQGKIIAFLIEYIITRFGVPKRLIMDNGPNLKGKDMQAFCKKFHITQTFSSVYYPQGNGQVEATNKILKSILSKTWDKYKRDWHEQLPYALFSYRTYVRIATGATPFSLVYGDEAIFPLELEIPSLKISLQGDIPYEDARKARLQQLEMLDGKRIRAIEHQKVYNAKLKREFGKKIKATQFKIGDLILKENINKTTANEKAKGKFEPNWLGPYVVADEIGSGAYRLSTLDGKEEPKTFNAIHLKHFYA